MEGKYASRVSELFFLDLVKYISEKDDIDIEKDSENSLKNFIKNYFTVEYDNDSAKKKTLENSLDELLETQGMEDIMKTHPPFKAVKAVSKEIAEARTEISLDPEDANRRLSLYETVLETVQKLKPVIKKPYGG